MLTRANPRWSLINVVQARTLSARSRAADDPKLTDLPWLKELHSKIWNREDRKPTLFRRVEVTQAHYAALQKRLKELHSDRDSPDYDGTKLDVLSVKLDFLRSLTPAKALSPRDNDDRIDDDEGNPEIKSLFPSILSFLDLSTLELKKKLPNRLPLPLLLRQEYKGISKLIENQPQNSGGSVIVSGQPGMGKTAYLYLRIIENMIEGRPFLYQGVQGTVYHVAEKGVEAVESWSSEETTVAFVDGDNADYGPDEILLRRSVQLIVASPPKGAYQKWIKQTGHASFVTKLAVKLWSREELLLTGIFLHSSDLTFKLLRESTSYFGYNPRRFFEASSSVANLEVKTKEVASIISDAADNGRANISRLLRKTRTGDSNVSHTNFQISPTNTDTEGLLSAVSRRALDLLLQQYDFYRNISVIPGAAWLQGHLFERQVLNYLCGISEECKFSIRRLTDTKQKTWTYRGPIERFNFQESTFLDGVTEAVQHRRPVYLVPLVRNFPAVDSILYDPDDPDAVLTCIQITINKDHPIAVLGLQLIQSLLKPPAGLPPTKTRQWRFLFVVPFGMESTFKSQKLNGDTPKGEWAEKVDQYVLGLEEQTIFRRSDSSVQRAITSQEGEQ